MEPTQHRPPYARWLLRASHFFFWAMLVTLIGTGLFTMAVVWGIQVENHAMPDWCRTMFYYLLVIFLTASFGLWTCSLIKIFWHAKHRPAEATLFALILMIVLSLPMAVYVYFRK